MLFQRNELIAFVAVNEDQDEAYRDASWSYTQGRVAVIHRLCVHPEVQGFGHGKRILKAAEDQIQKMGYSIIRLDAFSQNVAAIRMYESFGYHLAGEVHFRKGLFYLFEKAYC